MYCECGTQVGRLGPKGVAGEGAVGVGVQPPGLRAPSDPVRTRDEQRKAPAQTEGPVPQLGNH